MLLWEVFLCSNKTFFLQESKFSFVEEMTAHFSLVSQLCYSPLFSHFFLKSTSLYIYVTKLLDVEPCWQKSTHTFVDLPYISTWDKTTFHVSNKIELFPQWISPYSEQSPWILFTIHSGLTDVLNNLKSKLFINLIALLTIAKYWETFKYPLIKD